MQVYKVLKIIYAYSLENSMIHFTGRDIHLNGCTIIVMYFLSYTSSIFLLLSIYNKVRRNFRQNPYEKNTLLTVRNDTQIKC